tara:strand:+ start:386 stop:661 length:276 start_codon:yes stop_codon:yes gene_type:complete
MVVTIIIIYNYCNNIIFYQRRRRSRNRLSPEMYNVLERILIERNIEQARINQEEEEKKIKEIELKQKQNKNKYKVIIINPDENIELGTNSV